MTTDEAKTKLTQIIATLDDVFLRAPVADAALTTKIKDLGLDSIGQITLFYALIDSYGVELDETVAASWETLGDVLAFVQKLEAP